MSLDSFNEELHRLDGSLECEFSNEHGAYIIYHTDKLGERYQACPMIPSGKLGTWVIHELFSMHPKSRPLDTEAGAINRIVENERKKFEAEEKESLSTRTSLVENAATEFYDDLARSTGSRVFNQGVPTMVNTHDGQT